MQRITVTFDDELADEIDRFAHSRGYQSRSEALRDLARAGLGQIGREAEKSGECVGILVYAYEHDRRELPKRLTNLQHEHHHLSVWTNHVHLDHDTCLEVAMLRGQIAQIRSFADGVIAERGVRHGQLVVVPVETSVKEHSHGGHTHRHEHVKVRK